MLALVCSQSRAEPGAPQRDGCFDRGKPRVVGPRGRALTQVVVWEGFLEKEVIPEVSPKQRKEDNILEKHTHNNIGNNFERKVVFSW